MHNSEALESIENFDSIDVEFEEHTLPPSDNSDTIPCPPPIVPHRINTITGMPVPSFKVK